MNWNQVGMPTALVADFGRKRTFAEFKMVLNDAQNRVMQPVDVERMAQTLLEAGGREFVEMVRELTAALTHAQKELDNANLRYERLTADLRRRGIDLEEKPSLTQEEAAAPQNERPEGQPSGRAKPPEDGLAEWEEWDRRFRALLA